MLKHRNANLDFLRAIAVLLVLGRHGVYYPVWHRMGWVGVDLFFVLSGFLISSLLFSEFQRRQSLDIRRFYIRRGLKIYPAFYTFIGITVLNSLLHGHPGPAWKPLTSELLFLQSYIPGLWWHTWSLAVEEHFYIALPIVLWLLHRTKSEDPFRAIPVIFAIVAAGDLVLRIAAGWRIDYEANFADLFPTHLRIDGLFCGVALSYYRHFRPAQFAKFQGKPILYLFSALLLTPSFFLPVEHHVMHTVGVTCCYVAFGLLLVCAIDAQPTGILRTAVRAVASVGAYSYSIYLWHMFVRDSLTPHLHIRSGFLRFWVYVVASLLVGIVMSKLIEIPALAFRDRVFPPKATDPAASVSVTKPSRPIVTAYPIADAAAPATARRAGCLTGLVAGAGEPE